MKHKLDLLRYMFVLLIWPKKKCKKSIQKYSYPKLTKSLLTIKSWFSRTIFKHREKQKLQHFITLSFPKLHLQVSFLG